MADLAIEADGLTKVYGSLTAVDHVHLEVPSGTIFGLLGPNGAGKTTIIKLLTGLSDLSAGNARVAGYDVRTHPMQVKQRIGWVAAEVILDDDFTAWENLWLQAKLQRLVGWKGRAEELLQYFSLSDRKKDKVSTYSTGMRKKLEISLALLHQPSVIFMDEPTIGLDPSTRRMLWELITGVNKEFGVTVLLTSHYMEEADQLCGSISIIDHGRFVASGTPAELKSRVTADLVELETSQLLTAEVPPGPARSHRGAKSRIDLDLADHILRGAPPSLVRVAPYGRDPSDQRRAAEPRDGLPRPDRSEAGPGRYRGPGLSEVLRDDAEGPSVSTETKFVTLPVPAPVLGEGAVGQWSQFSGLYTREILRTFRNPLVLLVTVAQPFMWLAFFGSSFSGAPSGLVRSLFGTSSYIAFLLPGVLSTSMLTIGMFGAMSTIQDKRFGFMKRILLTPTSKATVFLAKALGATTRGLVGIPIMVGAAVLFGVQTGGRPPHVGRLGARTRLPWVWFFLLVPRRDRLEHRLADPGGDLELHHHASHVRERSPPSVSELSILDADDRCVQSGVLLGSARPRHRRVQDAGLDLSGGARDLRRCDGRDRHLGRPSLHARGVTRSPPCSPEPAARLPPGKTAGERSEPDPVLTGGGGGSRDEPLRPKVVEDPAQGHGQGVAPRIHDEVGIEGLLERIVYAGHVGDGALGRAPVDPLRVPLLAHGQGAFQPDLREPRPLDRAGRLAGGLVRGDHRHEHRHAISSQQTGYVTDPASVDLPILPGPPQLRKDHPPDLVPVEDLRLPSGGPQVPRCFLR